MTAFYLQKYASDWVDYTVTERTPKLGGKVVSTHESGPAVVASVVDMGDRFRWR